jgi:hypothetical protein
MSIYCLKSLGSNVRCMQLDWGGVFDPSNDIQRSVTQQGGACRHGTREDGELSLDENK